MCGVVAIAIGCLVLSSAMAAPAGGAGLLGQTPPGPEPVKLAPEILAAGVFPHGALALTPDNRTIFWSGATPSSGPEQTIYTSSFDGTTLAKPVRAPFAAEKGMGGPALSLDGERLFFNAEIPFPGAPSKTAVAIRYVEKTASGWGSPVTIESTVDTTIIKGQVTVARNGNLYFSGRYVTERTLGIFLCRFANGKYDAPAKLAGAIAALPLVTDPWVDPDERFILLGCPPAAGPPMRTDIGISRRQADGTWGAPVKLGGGVNTDAFERFPSLSRDGKFLFFIRSTSPRFVGDQAFFYWVDASVLDSAGR